MSAEGFDAYNIQKKLISVDANTEETKWRMNFDLG
jgi:hypothetical protein